MLMDWSYVFTVVLTGMVVVFLGLVLLIAAITIMGKIFEALRASKKDEKPAPAAKAAPAPAPPPPQETKEAEGHRSYRSCRCSYGRS